MLAYAPVGRPAKSTRVKSAILEGEAHAFGRLSTVVAKGLKAVGGASDLAEVARSFGGAVKDSFIQARLPGIHRRVAKAFAKAFLFSEPRRGFDALVDALLPNTTALEEAPLELEIARAIGADADDRVVHVLAVRILALRRSE